MGMNFPNVLVVHAGLGVKTLAEFIALAKKEPGKLNYASTGPGSASHLAGELFSQRAGIELVHVPYKGGAPALTDLLAGRVAAYFSTLSTAQAHIESGKLIPLASTGLTRPSFPTCRRLPSRASRVSVPPTGTRSWRRAGRPSRSSSAGTRNS
jgi:tripartite-type tricarboxylate transporter receptor subunit TctC